MPILVEKMISEIIEDKYLTNRSTNKIHVYSILKDSCKSAGLTPPSRQAFYNRLEDYCTVSRVKKREGAKRAYQYTAYFGVSEEGDEYLLRSVSRYLERCHMDHTQLDIQLISYDGVLLGKPWLTIIVDEYTGFILSAYLSFSNPGTPAVMSSIRLMVFMHEVFPESIVVDGGKEFESIYFEKLMASYGCTIISRKGKPRSGVAVERVFGSINKLFLDNLSGNNKIAKNIREVSSSHNPVNLAIWEPIEFYQELLLFIKKLNENNPKKGGVPPAVIRDDSIKRFGLPDSRRVLFDEDFQRNVLPSPKKWNVNVNNSKTIQINRVKYWHSCLRSIPKTGVNAELRYDPFDLNVLYVNIKGDWLKFNATKQVHRKLDVIESAVQAEVSRHSLFIHEKSKGDVRDDIALDVERANQDTIIRRKASQERVKSTVSIADEPEAVDIDIWSVDIPESRRSS